MFPNSDRPTQKSTVDYILVSDSVLPCLVDFEIAEDQSLGSDHRPLKLTFRAKAGKRVRAPKRTHIAWRLNRLDSNRADQFTSALERAMTGFVSGMVSADECCQIADAVSAEQCERLLAAWSEAITQTGLDHIGKKLVREDGSSKSWFTAELREKRRSVDAMKKRMLQVGN